MAYCAIKRDQDGKIKKVVKRDGSESELYTTIAKHPLVGTQEEALALFKNKFSDRFKTSVAPTKGNRLFNKPLKEAASIADQYMESIGQTREKFKKKSTIDKDRARAIAMEFERMEPGADPLTMEAYNAMIEETVAQYRFITEKGYTIEVNNEEPYASSADMIQDLRDNRNMKIFSTEAGFGTTAITEEQRNENPLLQKTEFRDKNGVPLLANDLFRFVHDFFGHAELGNGFGPIGEENAWNVHVRMYTPLAARAMTTETRGQNSWVNFSGVNEEAFKLRNQARSLRKQGKFEEAEALTGKVYEIMKFADQKIGLLPEWVSDPNGSPTFGSKEFLEMDPTQQAAILGYKEEPTGSKISKDGKFLYSKGQKLSVEDVVDTRIMTPEEIELLETWGGQINMYGNRGGIYGGIASYNNSDKSINIHLNNPLGAIILSNQREVNRAVLHEIIHANIDSNVKDRTAFDNELSEVVKVLSENKTNATPYVQRIIDFIEGGKPEEVLTYMLTTKQLAEFMDQIDATQAEAKTATISLWDKLLNMIKRALDGFSLADQAVDILNRYTKTDNGDNALRNEIDRIKSTALTDTDGNTFEVTKDVYKKGGLIIPVKSLTTTQTELSEQMVDDFIRKNKALALSSDLKVGIYKFPNSDMVSIDLNLVTPRSNIEIAKPIVKALGQQSLYNLDTGDVIEVGNTGLDTVDLQDKTISSIKQALDQENLDLVAEELGLEPTLTHKVNGNFTTSFKEALNMAEEGQEIEVGFIFNNAFTPLVSTTKNTNKNTQEGYVNNMIASGYLSDKKVKSRGEYVFEADGVSELQKTMAAEVINDDARAYLGLEGVQKDGYTFKLNKVNDRLRVIDKDGNTVEAEQKDIDTKSYRELEAEYGRETALNIVAEREWYANKEAYRNDGQFNKDSDPAVSEEEVQLRILNFLNKLGVKTVSISEYLRKYQIKNKVNPSAKALADIANEVIAVTEGRMVVAELAEETAHFINEAMPQDQVRDVLADIHITEEWAQFSDIYREIYRDEYPEDQLDEVVRREVLGKIVAKSVLGQYGENTLEIQKNLFRRVFDAIMEFFGRIANHYTPAKSTELQGYLKDVEKLLTQEDITDLVNTDNFKHNTFRFYSLGNSSDPADRLRVRSLALVNQLKDAEKTYMKSGSGRRTNVKELEKIQNQLETAMEVNSIASLVSMLNSNVKGLEAAIKDSEKNNKPYFLTDEESILYQFVKGVGKKGVAQIKELVVKVNEVDSRPEWKTLIKELTDTSEKITSLEAKAEIIDSRNVSRLVDEMMEKHRIPEQDRQLVEKWIDRAQADTNLFHATFGQLVHAKDGLLNLGGRVIRRMHNEAQVDFFNATKQYQDRLRELGISEQEIGQKFVDGNYIVSEFDYNKFESEMDNIFVDTYKQTIQEALPKLNSEIAAMEARTDLSSVDETRLTNLRERAAAYKDLASKSQEELVKLKNNQGLTALTLEEETRRKNLERPKKVSEIERPMLDSYYQQYEDNLAAAGVSELTKQELSNLLGDLSDLRKKAFRKEGDKTILDYNSLSESDLVRLSELQRKRKAMKSFTDELGALKPGLEYEVKNGEIVRDSYNRPIVTISNRDLMTPESIVAWDINNLDKLMSGRPEQQSAQLFYDTLDRVDAEEGREAALRFMELNSYMGFSQEFWDSMGSTQSIVDKLNKYKPESEAEQREVNRLKNNIITATFEMKNSLKTYNKKGNPSETDVDMMTSQAKEFILDRKEEIRSWVNQARYILKQVEEEDGETDPVVGTSDVNESYRKELETGEMLESEFDSPERSLLKAQEEADFAAKHMTKSDQKTVSDIQYSINSYKAGRKADVSRAVHNILDQLDYNVEDLADQKVNAEVIRTAVRQRLAPYYKRFTSSLYTNFYESLKTSPSLSEALQGEEAKAAMVEVNPNYSFYDQQENDQLNPNYDKNFDGGYLQPKKIDKYNSSKFESLFGTITTDAQGNKTSSKNQNLYKAYLATLDYNKSALEAMNVGENHNKFLLPQIRKNKIERFSKFVKGNVQQNVRNFTKDVLSYTEDEMIQGDEMYGNDVKVIPKMYVRKLDNPEDVSNDLFHSLSLRAKEGFLRKAKVKNYGDLMSIHDKILTRDMNGKSQEASNTYKMFKSAIDYNLFGIKETATYPINTPFGVIDLTKIARMLLNFVKFRNLGLNVVIPLTSLLTGTVTRKIEALTGEFIDTRSQKLGAREFTKIGADGMKEIGVVNTRAKINVLGQFYKAFDLQESFANSNYGYLLRNMPRSGMALHAAANYPLYGKTMLGILHDYRIVDGQVMNKNKFKRIKASANLSKDDLESQWKSYESKAIYKFIKHDGNQVSYDRDALGKELLKEGLPLEADQLENEINEIHNDIQGNIQYVNSIIDGQIPEDDRVHAQRHYLLSYFMTHRGWLSIATARKFKNRHLNLDTGVVEEGTYRSMFNYLGDYLKEFSEGNKRALIGNFREAWRKGDDVQRRNIKRVGIELGSLATLMVLGLALRAAAEDDENEDLFALQLANYLTYRTLNELSSVQFNIATNFSDTIESPFVGWSTVKNLTQIGDVFSGEEVKYGTYKGMTKRDKFFTKMVPGMKQVFDLQNMNQTYDTYRFYNQSNFSLTPVNLLWESTIDKKEK